ncbi:MAG: hypothetical protein PUC29_04440 [Clostridia bacterium]|nr:hypothetical protein [Clostridia bacterium]
MSENKKKNKRILFTVLIVICIFTAVTVLVRGAYFAKGEFKDVFINKKDYFSADVLYGISSLEAEKSEVGSSGAERNINIYNYNISTGDFNSFDVEFDVYAWLERELPDGKSYVLSNANGNKITFTNQTEANPVFTNMTLPGGVRSTATLTVDFGFKDDDDLTTFPGLYVVAVPTSPQRLNKVFLGALICPTRSDAFNIVSAFDNEESVDKYAAFTYRVNTVGIAPENDKIRIKWKSDALILIRVNGEDPETVTVNTGDYGNGFDRMIEWDAGSDQMDYFVFFRNSENPMWDERPTWAELRDLVQTEHITDTQG